MAKSLLAVGMLECGGLTVEESRIVIHCDDTNSAKKHHCCGSFG